MFKKHDDGSYSFSHRFWIYTVIATTIICWIGWRTQSTANQVEDQAASTAQFANDTNDCLVDVVNILTTRVGYNDEIAKLDARRQVIWDRLVDDLSAADNNPGLSKEALDHFRVDNANLKADQAKVIAQRDTNTYPECPSTLAKSPGK